MKRILVWHQGALGDFILSLPCIYEIRKLNEGAHIHLVSRTDISGIVLENDLVDAVSSNEKGLYAGLFADSGRRPPELGEFLRAFNTAFIFMRRPDQTFLENLRAYVDECFFIRTVPPAGVRKHVSEFQTGQIRALSKNAPCPIPFLDVPLLSEITLTGKKVISIHPGSGGKKKCWPLENYFKLVLSLASEQTFFYIILGPTEGPDIFTRVGEFISGHNISAGLVAGKPVPFIASLLKASSLYIGNDSGITHLAAALGTPAIALFGPTDHEVWRPSGNSVRVVRSGYPCSPCPENDYRSCTKQICLETLDAGRVLDALKEVRD